MKAERLCWNALTMAVVVGLIPFLIHTHKNLAPVPVYRTSNQAAKHQTPEFLTANKR